MLALKQGIIEQLDLGLFKVCTENPHLFSKTASGALSNIVFRFWLQRKPTSLETTFNPRSLAKSRESHAQDADRWSEALPFVLSSKDQQTSQRRRFPSNERIVLLFIRTIKN